MPRFQLSLRTLLVAMTMVALIAAVVGQRANVQKQAVYLLEEKGSSVAYRHQEAAPRTEWHLVDHPAPKWLRKVIGDDFFRTVTAAWIDSKSFTDADLDILVRLPELEYLFVSARSAGMTAKGLTHFQRRHPKCFVQE